MYVLQGKFAQPNGGAGCSNCYISMFRSAVHLLGKSWFILVNARINTAKAYAVNIVYKLIGVEGFYFCFKIAEVK